MPSAQFAARIVNEYFPNAPISLERGAHNGKPLGSYNSNPNGKIYVQTLSGVPIADVIQAHVTEEQAPGPGLEVLREKLAEFKAKEKH